MKILITGAASGIGYATALKLIEKEHYVYITVETDSQLDNLKKREELKKHENVEMFKLDITKEEDRNKAKELNLDVLINNAAVGIGGSLIDATESKIRESYEVNVFGTFMLTKLVIHNMVKRNSGRILNVSSILGEFPFAWLGIYSSTKAAIKNMTIALSKELKEMKSKVKVIVIEPGAYHTGFNQVMLENKYDKDNSIFESIEDKIRTKENIKFGILESYNLDSIVNEIVEATESTRPKLIYKAPFNQTIMEKIYMIMKK